MPRILVLDPTVDGADISKSVGGLSRAVVWPGMGAKKCAMHYVTMKPGQDNVPHAHPESEDVIYILQGEGEVENADTGEIIPYKKGNIIYIPAGVSHAVKARGDIDYIAVGAQAPFDLAFYKKAGLKW